MREILFRGKRVDNGGWVEGYYAVKGKGTDLEKHFIVTSTFDSNTNAYPFYFTDNWVDPETVCQYTGLTDRNGRKIFEGDILSAHLDDQYPEDVTYVQISWDGFSWCMRESMEDDVMTEHDCNIFEVCGNIFDNPELIGDQP